MAINNYFKNYSSFSEQKLVDDLVIESIKIHGIDTFYVAREYINEDKILNDVSVSNFNRAFIVEMYVKSYDGFQGQGDFLSKFGGPRINDQITLSVAVRSFKKNVTNFDQSLKRPREGDLIFFPMNQKFFEITFVEQESVFYQAGKIFTFDITCELLEFTNQFFNTGVEIIDEFTTDIRTDNVEDLETLSEIDPISKNIFFDDEADVLVEDNVFDPFKDIITSITKR